MTYAELQTLLLDESHRPDLASRAPQFIRRAEAMIARELRAAEMIAGATLTDVDRLSAGSAIYELPPGLLEVRAAFVIRRDLQKVTLAALASYASSGPVVVYAMRSDPVTGLQMEFRAIPAAESEIAVEYFRRLPALANPTDTNTLLQNHESLYLHAALFGLYTWTQDLELAQSAYDVWADAVKTLNEQAGRWLGGAKIQPFYNTGHRVIARGY